MAAEKNQVVPLGEDAEQHLEMVKKGTPRYFLLIAKGPNAVYLALKKKPVKTNELAEAKKAGHKGDGYFGIVTGKGMDLAFNLAQADGYDKPPIKDMELRQFIQEHAGVKCQPTIQIVAVPPTIPFDEDDLKNPLVQRFLKLEDAAKLVATANPQQAAEITKRLSAIRTLLQGNRNDEAALKIEELTKALTEWGRPQTGGTTTTGTSTTGESQPTSAQNIFLERLRALKPRLEKAAGTTAGDEAKVRASEAGMLARKLQFDAALKLLDQVESLLDKAGDGRGLSEFPKLWPAAAKAWRTAIETVDGQMAKLGEKLKQSDNSDLVEIAEFGLAAVTGGHKVPLMAAVVEVDDAGGTPDDDLLDNVEELIVDFQEHLDADPRVAACDDNPVDVPVSIRKTLGPALNELLAAVQAGRG